MSTQKRAQLQTLMNQIEEMWGHLDTLFNSLNATNGWDQKHGPDWTFADIPYHLAYCNRDVVARGLKLGPDYPEAEQELLASPDTLNAWNARKFAERPASQTVAQSLAQWRESYEEIRRLTAEMTDTDLARPFFMPIYMGWVTARDGLAFCRSHDWSEFTQLRLHMGRTEPIPSPAITRSYLGFIMNFFPMFLNKEAAAGQQFTAVMAFTDPDVGAWTIPVAEGNASVSEGEAANADLVMTQSAETFEKSFRRMHNPVEAIQSGQIQVNNFESLATFGQLFPM
ncbi:MAG: DinB family protein [Chloroflexi bacterium]|nr:DinB family protein [Chloroflexota bacterium]